MNNTSLFPKVLLLEHSFNNSTGMGITLTNLFQDWPKDRIGIMSDEINISLVERIRPCALYTGITKKIKLNGTERNKALKPRNRILSSVRKLYYETGLSELVDKSTILPENLDKAKAFSPDIVFCSLGTLDRMRVCEVVHRSIPESHLVVYIVDDWVNSRVAERWPSFIWRRKYDKAFRRILSISSGNLSICEEMSRAYKERYGVDFFPFHNPVDVSYWTSLTPPLKYGTDTVSILYVGKINVDTEDCLLDCCQAVEELNSEGERIRFDVYSPDHRLKFDLFDRFEHCTLYPPIPHESIPELTKSYSALLLTLGFSPHSIKYVKLSMPTKLSEYLASGLPTILYCPDKIALYHYVHDNDCAIVCNKRGKDDLKQALLRLFDQEDVSHVVSNALTTAKKHDLPVIRKSFLNTLSGFLHSNSKTN